MHNIYRLRISPCLGDLVIFCTDDSSLRHLQSSAIRYAVFCCTRTQFGRKL